MKKTKPDPAELNKANEERAEMKKAFSAMRVELEHTGERVEIVLTRLRQKVAARPALRLVKSR
jgi:hypothetical protein